MWKKDSALVLDGSLLLMNPGMHASIYRAQPIRQIHSSDTDNTRLNLVCNLNSNDLPMLPISL